MGMVQFFQDGGDFMYWVLSVDLVSICIIMAAAASCSLASKGKFIRLTFILVLLPVFLGLLGQYTGFVSLMSPLATPIQNHARNYSIWRQRLRATPLFLAVRVLLYCC